MSSPSAPRPTDFLLLHLAWPLGLVQAQVAAPALRAAWVAACARWSEGWGAGQALQPQRLAWQAASQTLYGYARLAQRQQLGGEALASMAQGFVQHCPAGLAAPARTQVARLQTLMALDGPAQGASAAFHYVVETDAEPGWMPEIERWYDTEHLPGLAAVPGCIRAQRPRNHDAGPPSLACYDLERADTLESAAWLAVRASAWSSRTRPHFANTRRTLFEVLG